MNNIWSNNKYVNLTINVLLFLLGINVFHYGQLLLPIICLILFVDNKFKFIVNNKWTFVLLCLFAISFFAFSYNQGFYSVMAFCLPMAYYIGSNMITNDKEKIINIFYLISLGMIIHVILNFCMDIKMNGFHLFGASSHFDIWTKGKISSTSTAINYLPMIGFMYYLVSYEKRKIKKVFFISFAILMVYSIALAQRTTYLLIIVSFVISIIVDYYFNRDKFNKKTVFIVIAVLVVIVIFLILSFIFIPIFHDWIVTTRLFYKVLTQGFKSSRFDIFLNTIKLVPHHLWGGNEISTIIGIMPHDLWLDVYNWSGLVSCVILIAHTLIFIRTFLIFIKNKSISNEYKAFFIPLFSCILIQCLMEPIMSGASLFLIVVIIFESLIEKMNYGK